MSGGPWVTYRGDDPQAVWAMIYRVQSLGSASTFEQEVTTDGQGDLT
jgi:hypothetical protein